MGAPTGIVSTLSSMYTVVRAPTGIVSTLSSIYTVVRAPTGIVSTLSSIYTTLGGSNRNSEYTKFNLHNTGGLQQE